MKGRITFALLMLLVSIWGFASPKIAISPEYEANKRLAAIVFESILNHCDHAKLKEYYKLYKDFRPSFRIYIEIVNNSYINLKYKVENEQEAEKYFGNLKILIQKCEDKLNAEDVIYLYIGEQLILYEGHPEHNKLEKIKNVYNLSLEEEMRSLFSLEIMDCYFTFQRGKESDFKTENNTFDFLKRMVSKYRYMKVRTYKDIYGF